MGAGFRTAKAQFIDDKMLKLPYQLMSQVIQTKDEGNDKAYAEFDAFEDLLKLQSLDKDKDQAKELVNSYQSQVDNLARELSKNPLEYAKQLRKIRSIGRDLNRDMTEGKWGAIQSRYDEDTAYAKWLSEQKDYDDEYKQRKLLRSRENAGALKYDKDTGTYNKYKRENLYKLDDINSFMEEAVKGIVPETESIGYDSPSGQLIIKTFDGKTVMLDEARIAEVALQKMNANPELLEALRDRADLGMKNYKNIFDEKGNPMIVAGVKNNTVKGANGRAKNFRTVDYHDNILGNALSAVTDKYKRYDTDFNTGMKNAPGADARVEHELNKIMSPTVVNNEIVSNGIGDVATYNAVAEQTKQLLDNTISDAQQMLKESLGVEELTPAQIAALNSGNFESVFRTSNAAYSPEHINKLKTNYHQVLRQQAVLDGMADEFVNSGAYSQVYADGGIDRIEIDGAYYDKKAFDKFVGDRERQTTPVKKGWYGVGDKQRKEYQKQTAALFQNGLTTFKPIKGDITDMEGLLATGKIAFSQKTLRHLNMDKAQKAEEFQTLVKEEEAMGADFPAEKAVKLATLRHELRNMKDVEYTYEDTADFANFVLDEESIIPHLDLGGDNKLNVQANIRIGEEIIPIELDNIEYPELNEYLANNRDDLIVNQFQAMHQGLTSIPVPVGIAEDGSTQYLSGAVYNPKEGVVEYQGNKIPIHSDHQIATITRQKLFGTE